MRGPTRNARIAVAGLAVALSGGLWGTDGARGQDLGQQPLQQPPPPAPHSPTVTKPPVVLKAVEAIYQEALAERLSADVTMVIGIDATGKVTRTDVTRPAGHGFDEAAAAAVAQYQFSPAEVDGKPSPIRIEYTLHFVPNVVPDAGPPEEAPPPPPPSLPPQVVVASGRLREKGTREPLPAADVAIIARNADGSDAPAEIVGVTDLDGRFEVKAPAGRALRVVITDVAHDPCIRDLAAGSEAAPATLDCIVARRPGVGQETVVKAPPPTQAVTRYELRQPELMNVAGTFGDPLRVVQSLPGVARTPYGLGALIIRGASPDDSGIYVEGHPIPILYHFLIGPSVMTPRLIERIDFFPGNFGVQYGRATAGIVDVGLKTDPIPRVHGVADLNLLDSSAYVEGPLGKEWSGSVSARRSYIDLVLKAAAPSDTTVVAPAYYDYQAGVHRNLGNGRLSLFAFGSDDTLKLISKDDPNRGDIELNTAIGFHKLIAAWVTGLGAGWVNKLSPAVGYERVRFGAAAIEVNQSAYVAELRDELSRALTPALIFRVGFDGVVRREHLFFNLPVPPMARLWGDTIPMFQERTIPLDSLGAGLYSDVSWDLGRGVTVIPGLRGDLYRVVDQNRYTFDPRLVVRWKMRPTHTWKAGAGIYHQMPQAQLMTPEYGNPNLPPIWADQYSVGFVNYLTRKLSLDTTFYYVRRHDLPVPPPPFTANGQGRSYGMELILKHEFTDRFFGWLSYTLSRSEQTAYAVNTPMLSAPGLQDPNAKPMTWFPTDFDQTHNLIIVGSYKLGAWQLGGRFRLVTGAPDTPMREGAFDADTGMYACGTAPINSARKPTFHQLDVRAERLWTFTAWQLGAYVDIQNVLNAQNPEATIYDYRCRGTTALRGIPFFPIFGIRGLF